MGACLPQPSTARFDSDLKYWVSEEEHMKRLWLVRLGRNGEQEAHALDQNELVLGFEVGDLSSAKDRDAMLAIMKERYPDRKLKTQLNFAAQLNQFCNQMQIGDLAVVPLKTDLTDRDWRGIRVIRSQRRVSEQEGYLGEDRPAPRGLEGGSTLQPWGNDDCLRDQPEQCLEAAGGNRKDREGPGLRRGPYDEAS